MPVSMATSVLHFCSFKIVPHTDKPLSMHMSHGHTEKSQLVCFKIGWIWDKVSCHCNSWWHSDEHGRCSLVSMQVLFAARCIRDVLSLFFRVCGVWISVFTCWRQKWVKAKAFAVFHKQPKMEHLHNSKWRETLKWSRQHLALLLK